FFQAEDGIRDATVTGVQTCALPICGVCTPTAGSPGEHEGRREYLDPEDGPVDQVEKDDRRNQGKSDFVEAPEWSRSIDQRRFIEIGRASCRERGAMEEGRVI